MEAAATAVNESVNNNRGKTTSIYFKHSKDVVATMNAIECVCTSKFFLCQIADMIRNSAPKEKCKKKFML